MLLFFMVVILLVFDIKLSFALNCDPLVSFETFFIIFILLGCGVNELLRELKAKLGKADYGELEVGSWST